MNTKQNVVVYLDFNKSKIIIMLNYGVSTQSAKIEEYEFEKSDENGGDILEVLLNVLDSFVGENICKQANFYVVLPTNCFSFDYMKVPNYGANRAKEFVRAEVSKLYPNYKDLILQESLISKNLKTLQYKLCLTKKDLVNKISETFKKLSLNLIGIGCEVSAKFSALISLIKIKHIPFALIDIAEDNSILYYGVRDKLYSYYPFEYGKKQLEKNKTCGVLQNTIDSAYDVYKTNLNVKNKEVFREKLEDGIFLDEAKLFAKNSRAWKNINKNSNKGEIINYPYIKILQLLNENISNNDFQNYNNLYVNMDNKLFKKFKIDVKKDFPDLEVRNVFRTLNECPIKDYLHLYGILFEQKFQPENIFTIKRY